jgi:hypothetical protein
LAREFDIHPGELETVLHWAAGLLRASRENARPADKKALRGLAKTLAQTIERLSADAIRERLREAVFEEPTILARMISLSRPRSGCPPCRPTPRITRLVHFAKLCWLIERDYLELEQETGLGHYEGRGWGGFHHHGALCISAYGFFGRRAGRDSALGRPHRRAGPGASRSRRKPTPRRCRSEPNATFHPRSPP